MNKLFVLLFLGVPNQYDIVYDVNFVLRNMYDGVYKQCIKYYEDDDCSDRKLSLKYCVDYLLFKSQVCGDIILNITEEDIEKCLNVSYLPQSNVVNSYKGI